MATAHSPTNTISATSRPVALHSTMISTRQRIRMIGSEIATHMAGSPRSLDVVRSRTTPHQIRLGRHYARLRRWPWRDDLVYAAAELRSSVRARLRRPELVHVLYAEGHHHYLERWERAPRGVVATLHHPPEQWRQFHPSMAAWTPWKVRHFTTPLKMM